MVNRKTLILTLVLMVLVVIATTSAERTPGAEEICRNMEYDFGVLVQWKEHIHGNVRCKFSTVDWSNDYVCRENRYAASLVTNDSYRVIDDDRVVCKYKRR